MTHFLFKFRRLLIPFQPFLGPALKIIITFSFLFLLLILTQKIVGFATRHGVSGKDILSLAKDPRDVLATTDNLTNFLILGMRGEGSDSPDLTDTIIVASFSHNTRSITLLSVPRDLWINSLKIKINAAYHYGELKKTDGGLTLASAAIQESLGVPIHYSVALNFHGFIELIDLLNGVDINVEQGFTDSRFPIPGKENAYPESTRYETISFSQGLQLMDGETVLKFVRSRHADGEEGTDFARSRRQELLLSALRQKIISTNFLLNKDKLNQLYDIVNKNFSTDINPGLFPTMVRLALIARDSSLNSVTLSSEKIGSDIAVLENPKPKDYDNQWVLIARDGNWEALKQYIHNRLTGVQ